MSTPSFLQRVERFIEQEQLLTASARVVVGVSGGADSVALLHALVQLGYDCVACHCNFNLRGDESLRDREFTRQIVAKWGIPYEEVSFETMREVNETGESVEMVCRRLRYDWFEQMRLQYQAEAIAVAHHRDDSVETLLLNLVRGTGIAGLTAMRPRHGNVVRPLLSVTRQEVESYLEEEGLTYVTDHTNLESIYRRNKIRLEVLPLLRSLNPAVDTAIQNTILHLREVERVYRSTIEEEQKVLLKQQGKSIYLSIKELYQLPSPQTFLFEWLSPYGFESSRIDDIVRGCEEGSSGKQFYSSTHRLIKDREQLILVPRFPEQESVVAVIEELHTSDTLLNGQLSYRCIEATTDYQIPIGREFASFDADKLTLPMTIRRWQMGDRFRPFGMKGSRKLSDYFNDSKYSLVDKEEALLLCLGETIVWILGERVADGFRITSETKRIVEFNYKK